MEEQSNALKEMATASKTETQNPNQEVADDDSTDSREEGELSSSDNDVNDYPAGSVSQFTGSSGVGTDPIQVPSANATTQLLEAGKYVSTSNPASFVNVPSRTSEQPFHRKNFEKKRVPLVISFSDGDSDSGSEECRPGKSFECKGKGNIIAADRNRRQPPLANNQMLRGSTRRNNTKAMSRKVSLSRPFVSSITKINGASSRNGGPLWVKRSFHVKNFNTLNKIKAVGEHGSNQNSNLNNNEVRDLRQLIAIRENELKFKGAQQNKETTSDSCKDHSLVNLNNDTARMCREASAEFLQFKSKEPDMKRQKVGETHSSPTNTDSQQGMRAVEPTLAAKKPLLENRGRQDIGECGCCEKVTGTKQLGFNQLENQEANRPPVYSANLPRGTNIITKSSQCDRITELGAPSEQMANVPFKTFPKKSRDVELEHPGELICHHTASSLPNSSVPDKATSGYPIRTNQLHEVRSGGKEVNPELYNIYQASSQRFPDNNQETSNASLNNASFWNGMGKVHITGSRHMYIQSLLEIEELHDKELDKAQELRRRREIEERNALKAFRKAQRDLIEASATCSHLYRKRDLYAARIHSLMMEDPKLIWSSQPQDYSGGSGQQMQSDFNIHNQHGHDSKVRCGSLAHQSLSTQHEGGQNLVYDPCSEPDASTSEPQKDNGAATPSNDFNNSADEEEEAFLFDHKDGQSNLDRQRKDEIYDERRKDVVDESKTFVSSQDSLLLEASLRSQLFARLGIKKSSKEKDLSQSMEPTDESGAQIDNIREKMEIDMGNMPFPEAEKDPHLDLGDLGTDKSDRNIRELPVQINNQYHVKKFCSNYAYFSEADPGKCLLGCVTFLSPILRSAVGHVGVPDKSSLLQSQTSLHQIHTSDIHDKRGNNILPDGIEPIIINYNSMEVMDICVKDFGSYTPDLAIDPFWPLCMYELRGKCNNNECSWQHVRDYSCRITDYDESNSTGCQVHPSSGKFYGATNLSKCLNCLSLAPPTYLICVDILKADFHPYKSVLARSVGQCWRKNFSACLVLSSLLPTDLPSDEQFLHGTEAGIEVHGSWNRQSSYFHSRSSIMGQLDQRLADKDQSLEMALLNLNQEVNKQKGRIEALKVLARALEEDPTSVVLWIVYLHIYYSNQKSIGKDDMFHCAVEHNKGSYELWLMYINSRVRLDDKLVAYEDALSALCGHADKDAILASECILDLFLQMMNCLCISGNVNDAIQRIYVRCPSTKKSDGRHHLFLYNILARLAICEKFIFWVCCVYLIIYRKLPNAVVQRFECQKELSSIEWPSTHLTVEAKQKALTLMETAVGSLAPYVDRESLESETTLKAAHLFALNHVRCIAVLEGLECSRNLMDKYVKLYPTCLELVLMSARAWGHDSGDINFQGFEDAISSWLEEVPGIQCIWNQYAEYALHNGRVDFARELMDRWFHTVWEVQCSQSEILKTSLSDVVFGLLNLSLHKVLQNDHIEARIAIDRALKAASAEEYRHIVREHAMFLHAEVKDSSSLSGMLNMMNEYLIHVWPFPAPQTMSKKFIQSIKKPRVQLLVSNLLTPVSSDFSLVNLLLEVWYGQSLLPQLFDNRLNLVDLVEAITEILPANYQLAISLCKLLGGRSVSASVSFWASSLLVNALFQAVPVAPEYVWVEAAGILNNLTDLTQSISESFHSRALSIYPFSIKLWRSYLDLCKSTGNRSAVIEGARERGINLIDISNA